MLSRFERGQGLVEYALILALIAIAVITVLAIMGTKLNQNFTRFNNSFP